MTTLAEGNSGIDLFLPKTYDIFWSFIILVILAVFFYKYFLPKFQKIFDERAEKIQGNIDKAAKAQKEAEEAKKKYEDQLTKARVQASKIRDDARAEEEAAQVSANAQKSIESQQKQALVSLKGEVGSLSVALAGKILGKQLESDAVQSDMIDSVLGDLDKDDIKA